MTIIKPVLFSDIANISPDLLNELGVFNPILNYDTRYFVDPVLLKQSQNPIIQQSQHTFHQFFENLLLILHKVKDTTVKDRYYRAAKRMINFPEYPFTCIGYSKSHTKGNGSGYDLNSQILHDALDIVQSNIDIPSMFLVLPLLEKDIGADRISDMTQNIIDTDICNYTMYIMQELGIKGTMRYRDKSNNLFYFLRNPYSKHPIKLVPYDILTSLPLADDFDKTLCMLAEHNQRLRDSVNHFIGDVWHDTASRAEQKKLLLSTIKENPEFLIEVSETIRTYIFNHANFLDDAKGRYRWLQTFQSLSQPDLSNHAINCPQTPEGLYQAIYEILEHFKNMLENHNHWVHFWTENVGKTVHVEPSFSVMLLVLASDMWLKSQKSNIQIKFSNKNNKPEFYYHLGNQLKIIPHIHHSTNNNLSKAYTQALEQAQQDTQCQHIFIVFRFFPEKNKSMKQLETIAYGNEAVKVYYIDVSRQNDQDHTKYENVRNIRVPDYEARKRGAQIKNANTDQIKHDVVKPMFNHYKNKAVHEKINITSISNQIGHDLCELNDEHIDDFANRLNIPSRISLIKARDYARNKAKNGDYGQIPKWCYAIHNELL